MKEDDFGSLLEDSDALLRIFNRGVANAIEENKRFGIPSVFSINGTIVYQMPDGTVKMREEYLKEQENKIIN